jgi:hypothetical protein
LFQGIDSLNHANGATSRASARWPTPRAKPFRPAR